MIWKKHIEYITLTLKNNNWKAELWYGSEVKSTAYSSRVPMFTSQHLHGVSQLSVTSWGSENMIPFSDLHGYVNDMMHTDINAGKIYIQNILKG